MTDDTQTTFGEQDVEEGIAGEWELVRSWQSFLNFFEDAVHIDAVTYCESLSGGIGVLTGSARPY